MENKKIKNKYKILGINYIFKDFKDIPKIHAVLISIAAIFLVFTSIFTIDGDFSSISPFWETKGLNEFQLVMKGLSGFTAFTSIINVYLVARGKISNYTWGVVAVLLYGIFAFSVAYTGDSILNICFYLPFQFIGFHLWKKSMNENDDVIPKDMNINISIMFIFISIILFASFWFLIPASDKGLHKLIFGSDSYSYPYDSNLNKWFSGQGYLAHAFDAMTNTLSIVGSIMMFMKLRFQWWIWITNNIFQSIMYVGLNGQGVNVPILIMWSVFATNSIFAIKMWYFKLNKN